MIMKNKTKIMKIKVKTPYQVLAKKHNVHINYVHNKNFSCDYVLNLVFPKEIIHALNTRIDENNLIMKVNDKESQVDLSQISAKENQFHLLF